MMGDHKFYSKKKKINKQKTSKNQAIDFFITVGGSGGDHNRNSPVELSVNVSVFSVMIDFYLEMHRLQSKC